jgi:positive regulator of sigma E activity
MNPVPPDAITGAKLVLCAFLVFIVPFLAAVVTGGIMLYRYHHSSTISAIAAIAAGCFSILLVKLMTCRIGKTKKDK